MPKSKMKILIVEDDPAILDGLLDVLVFNGYLPEGVEDGGEGFKKALEGKYDLIILDLMLPTLDGISICKKIRQRCLLNLPGGRWTSCRTFTGTKTGSYQKKNF